MVDEDLRESSRVVKEREESIDGLKEMCKVLQMEIALNEKDTYFVIKNCGRTVVCEEDKNGRLIVVDDRGDLFVSLRNLAVNLIPNLEFKDSWYIFNRRQKEE